jgi:hypothetical protein
MNAITEADILSDVVAPTQPTLAPEAARAILDLRFNAAAVGRLNELAEKGRLGTLTEDERNDLDKYLRVGNFLNLIQAKARLSLATRGGAKRLA